MPRAPPAARAEGHGPEVRLGAPRVPRRHLLGVRRGARRAGAAEGGAPLSVEGNSPQGSSSRRGGGRQCAACGKRGRQGSHGTAWAVQKFGWLTVPAWLGERNAGPAGCLMEKLLLCCRKVKIKSHPQALKNVFATWSLRKFKSYTLLDKYTGAERVPCIPLELPASHHECFSPVASPEPENMRS